MKPNLGHSALDNQFIMTSTFTGNDKVSSVRGEDNWSWTKDPMTIISQDEGRSLQIKSNRHDIATWTFGDNEPSLEQPQHWGPSYLRLYVKDALAIVPRGSDMHNKLISIEEKLRETQGRLTRGSRTIVTNEDQQPIVGGHPDQQSADLAGRSPSSTYKQEDDNPNNSEGEALKGLAAGGI